MTWTAFFSFWETWKHWAEFAIMKASGKCISFVKFKWSTSVKDCWCFESVLFMKTIHGIVDMTNSIFWCSFNHSLKYRKFLRASPQVFPGKSATESKSRQSWMGTSLGSRHMNAAEELSRLAYLHLWAYLILLLYCFLTYPGIYYISQFYIFPNFSNHFYLLSLLIIGRCFCLRVSWGRAHPWMSTLWFQPLHLRSFLPVTTENVYSSRLTPDPTPSQILRDVNCYPNSLFPVSSAFFSCSAISFPLA